MAEFYASIKNELSKTSVSVTSVYPNWVKTGITERALKSDGTRKGKASEHESHGMDAGKCADIIIKAAAKRKREVVMTLQGKAGIWLRMIAPRLIDRIMISKTEQ